MKNIFELFGKVLISSEAIRTSANLDLVKYGVVTDFLLTEEQEQFLKTVNTSEQISTLFSVKERKNGPPEDLITKQLLHYIEVYGLGSPGLFNLEVKGKKLEVPILYVAGITQEQLEAEAINLAYSNAPLKDASLLRDIIRENCITLDINKVQNNELKVLLFRPETDVFESADDLVRYFIFDLLDTTLLIKDEKTISGLKQRNNKVNKRLLEKHADVLAKSFNRFKPLILALKNKNTAKIINKISKMSKSAHVPLKQSFTKTFIADAYRNHETYEWNLLERVSMRDLFKFLNLLKIRKEKIENDVYLIRNGKIHVKPRKQIYNVDIIETIEENILREISIRLTHLKNKNILLDDKIDFGLPISRKQTVGDFPFGSRVSVSGNRISFGIHWKNSGGATDLDLSCIDLDGKRVGWGSYRGYGDDENGILFSGDVVSAPGDGAMEFFTSGPEHLYALYMNVFSGNENSDYRIIVGREGKNQWIKDIVFAQDMTTKSRSSFLGIVNGNDFIVYDASSGDNSVSFRYNPNILKRAAIGTWTIKELFDRIGINYEVDKSDNLVYDYHITSDRMTFTDLERLFEDTNEKTV